jgi:hypothetical protein
VFIELLEQAGFAVTVLERTRNARTGNPNSRVLIYEATRNS